MVSAPPPFHGIPVAALDFYEDLEADNTKSFWNSHKQVYDQSVRAPIEELAAALAPAFGPGKLFRPYRDVRFAKDKTPYKTHQGVWFGESARYLHVSAAGLFVAGWRFLRGNAALMQNMLISTLAQMTAGVTLALENHIDFTSIELLQIVEGVDSEYLKVNFDTGNALRLFEAPVEAARAACRRCILTTMVSSTRSRT